mmetsp:Transcript_17216/g.47409  ORF Transcript_17216/g.47409 Transcript_17216/m.47409 type:complete len:327 (+) Transcript_17216:606-1586(+)
MAAAMEIATTIAMDPAAAGAAPTAAQQQPEDESQAMRGPIKVLKEGLGGMAFLGVVNASAAARADSISISISILCICTRTRSRTCIPFPTGRRRDEAREEFASRELDVEPRRECLEDGNGRIEAPRAVDLVPGGGRGPLPCDTRTAMAFVAVVVVVAAVVVVPNFRSEPKKTARRVIPKTEWWADPSQTSTTTDLLRPGPASRLADCPWPGLFSGETTTTTTTTTTMDSTSGHSEQAATNTPLGRPQIGGSSRTVFPAFLPRQSSGNSSSSSSIRRRRHNHQTSAPRRTPACRVDTGWAWGVFSTRIFWYRYPLLVFLPREKCWFS